MGAGTAGRTGYRAAAIVVALLALVLRIAVPSGFMPGASLAAPLVLCPGQGPMPGMAMGAAVGGKHAPAKSRHDAADRPCAFAGLGVALPGTPAADPSAIHPAAYRAARSSPLRAAAPGRGLAAPPPPSHAPPVLRA